MAIEEQELLRRLSFIKYLFTTATEQADKPEPLCIVSILLYHDSIELFLHLACEHHDIDASKSDFIGYFSLLRTKINLTQTETMRRFNKSRVNLKHHGIMVSKADLDSFKISCQNFFVENTKSVFEIEFDDISLVDLVPYKRVKEHLLMAENELKILNYERSINEITLAFWEMIAEYKEGKIERYGKSPTFHFSLGYDLHSSSDMYKMDGKIRDLQESFGRALNNIEKTLDILTLGITYQKFAKFDSITPNYTRTYGGCTLNKWQDIEYNNDNVKWCFDFVIECCIKLQEYDYKVLYIKDDYYD